MANPLHIDVNCRIGQVEQRPLSDQELTDHLDLQNATTTQLQADDAAWSTRRAQLRALLLLHPELQPLVDMIRLKLT